MPMNNYRYSFFFHESKNKRGPMLRRYLLIGLFFFLPVLLFTQVSSGADQLKTGLLLFKQEKYQEAIRSFREVIINSEASDSQADAYYWTSRAYLAINMYEEAERNLEHFLATYPTHPLYPDALYQKGRLLYLQGDPENSIQVLESFVAEYPDSDYLGSAYFWLGECLLSLGHPEEAARVFNKVIEESPKSVKLEASRYRLSLIEFKKREDELLKLLNWSHEEALKSVEEFQRRERAYEQAINVYQRKLSGEAGGMDSVTGVDSAELERLKNENDALKSKIAGLEAELAALSVASGAEEAAEPLVEEDENRQKTLELKDDALALRETLLQTLAERTEQGQ
jgi:TolA-binding protein